MACLKSPSSLKSPHLTIYLNCCFFVMRKQQADTVILASVYLLFLQECCLVLSGIVIAITFGIQFIDENVC